MTYNLWIVPVLLTGLFSSTVDYSEAAHSRDVLGDSANDDVRTSLQNMRDNRHTLGRFSSDHGSELIGQDFNWRNLWNKKDKADILGDAQYIFGGNRLGSDEYLTDSDWSQLQDYISPESLPNSQWEKDYHKMKRQGHSLSIVNPLDVLRQRLILENARRRMKENQDQIKANEVYLKSLGKRSVKESSAPSEDDKVRRFTKRMSQADRRRSQREEYLNRPQGSVAEEFDV